jgi:hypothetical protein
MLARSAAGKMHIDQAGRQYTAVDGSVGPTRVSCCAGPLVTSRARRGKETLANLSALPPEGDQCASQGFEGATIVDADVAFETGLSVPHEVLRWRM